MKFKAYEPYLVSVYRETGEITNVYYFDENRNPMGTYILNDRKGYPTPYYTLQDINANRDHVHDRYILDEDLHEYAESLKLLEEL